AWATDGRSGLHGFCRRARLSQERSGEAVMTAARHSLTDLEAKTDFRRRHIGPGEAEIAAMLREIGLGSLDELVERTVPEAIRSDRLPDLPPPLTEAEALAQLSDYAALNQPATSLIGLGYHDCHTPPVIQRNLLENPGWYTAYTPYQPEISQGRLEALVNFQQTVVDLTGLEL